MQAIAGNYATILLIRLRNYADLPYTGLPQ